MHLMVAVFSSFSAALSLKHSSSDISSPHLGQVRIDFFLWDHDGSKIDINYNMTFMVLIIEAKHVLIFGWGSGFLMSLQ